MTEKVKLFLKCQFPEIKKYQFVSVIQKRLQLRQQQDPKINFLKMQSSQKIQDYSIIRKLGQGSFGQVLLGRNSTGKNVAIKKISKEKVIKVNKLHEPFIQKEILFKLNQSTNNFFIKIQGTHSDENYVYLVLEFCQGGTLDDFIKSIFVLMKENDDINVKALKNVMARLVLMMEQLHLKKLIHRDLKPSNILLTKDGFLKLSDFGTCFAPDDFFTPEVSQQIKSIKNMAQNKKDQKTRKMSEEDECSTTISQRRYTFVGTAWQQSSKQLSYMAPQLLSEDKCGPESDLWALGCIFYEMLHKKPPFYDQSQGMVWTKILNSQVKVYSHTQGKEINEDEQKLQNLIQSLLVKEYQKRLGYGNSGYENLKSHQFFKGIDWKVCAQKPINEVIQFVQSHISFQQLELQKKKSQKDKVIFSGVVGKKMYFGNYKDRTLVLHSFPKLVYYDTDSGQKKGQIVLQKSTPVKGDAKYFQVSTQKKTYYFKSKQSKQWVDMIKLSILSAFY